MDWGFLSFLAEPWFVIPWYAVGLAGMAVVIYDLARINTPLKPAMKWAWPIIVLFFSVLGLALYYGTARAPGIGGIEDEKKKKEAHAAYEKNMARRVNGAVIHCVAGDGLGIMTGMVIARAVGMSFWQEFWFEYLIGFLCGWLLFQYKSMTMMTDKKGTALAMAFRAEFFSMLTVMAGMGAVMGYVTPLAVTEQPKPLTFAFWGFGMLGLLVGFVFTYPMNWMMVKAGWKHGMGGMSGEHQVKARPLRLALVTAMIVLGFGAMVIPAWLDQTRAGRPIGSGTDDTRVSMVSDSGLAALQEGIEEALATGLHSFETGKRSDAAHAVDAALRAVEVGKEAAQGSAFKKQLDLIEAARHALHVGDEQAAKRKLESARSVRSTMQVAPPPADPQQFGGATVVNSNGVRIGRISGITGGQAELSLGGLQDIWGFWDISVEQSIQVDADTLMFGPSRTIGNSLAAVPTGETPPIGRIPTAMPGARTRGASQAGPPG